MQYVIEIQNKTIGAETNSVNAKELHNFIQSKSRFNDWIINRISKYGFTENQDYIIVTTSTGGRPSKEYYITLDMAKELSMVENNEKGREARRWFIEIAKQTQVTPTQLDLITPYEVRRDLTTARRLLTLEKKKHRETAEFYEKKIKKLSSTKDIVTLQSDVDWWKEACKAYRDVTKKEEHKSSKLKQTITQELDNMSHQLTTQFTQILENDIKMIREAISVSVLMMHKKITLAEREQITLR